MLQLKTGISVAALKQPLKNALPLAADIGVDGIEINARTELRPQELSKTGIRHLRKLLQDYELQVCSINFPTRRSYGVSEDLERRLDATKAAMKMAFDLGCNHVSSFVSVQSCSELERATLFEALTDLGMYGQRVGARFAIRTGGDTGEALQEFIQSMPPASIVVDFDPAELLLNKKSPTEALRQVGEHVVHFRARDAVHDLSMGRGVIVQLGRGSNDWATLLATLEEYQYDGFITLEPAGSDTIAEAHESVEYLRNLFS